jgi:hypothetical protein
MTPTSADLSTPVRKDALIFAEDPGAVNYVAALPVHLQVRGYSTRFLTLSHASRRAEELGVEHESLVTDPQADEIVNSLRPRVVVTGTSDRVDTPGLEFIAAARRQSIPSLGIVDGQAAYGHRFRGRGDTAIFFAPDWLAVPDAITAGNYVEVGFAADRVRVVGHPHYETINDRWHSLETEGRAAIRRRVAPDAGDRQIVVFATEISTSRGHATHTPLPDDTLTGYSGTPLRVHRVLEEFLAVIEEMAPRPYLILRLHPKTQAEEFSAYLGQFDLVSNQGEPASLVYAADLVVGLTTILLEEAALVGTPALALIRRREEVTWLMGVRDGWIPYVTRRDDIPPVLRATAACSRAEVRSHAAEAIIPGSGDRLARLVISLIEGCP